MINKEYKKFVENYIPYKWEININDTRRNYRKNNSLVINYKRFELIKKYLENIINHDGKWKIIDFGPYPGNLVKLLKYFFEKKNKGDYLGVGIGFSSDFQNEMENAIELLGISEYCRGSTYPSVTCFKIVRDVGGYDFFKTRPA